MEKRRIMTMEFKRGSNELNEWDGLNRYLLTNQGEIAWVVGCITTEKPPSRRQSPIITRGHKSDWLHEEAVGGSEFDSYLDTFVRNDLAN